MWVNGVVEDWHDGDTGHVTVTLPDGEWARWVIRVRGINARELDEPGGPEAHAALDARLPHGTPVVLAQVADDKYGGREDAALFYLGPDGAVRDLATDLITDGWAAAWGGSGHRPVPPWPRT